MIVYREHLSIQRGDTLKGILYQIHAQSPAQSFRRESLGRGVTLGDESFAAGHEDCY